MIFCAISRFRQQVLFAVCIWRSSTFQPSFSSIEVVRVHVSTEYTFSYTILITSCFSLVLGMKLPGRKAFQGCEVVLQTRLEQRTIFAWFTNNNLALLISFTKFIKVYLSRDRPEG